MQISRPQDPIPSIEKITFDLHIIRNYAGWSSCFIYWLVLAIACGYEKEFKTASEYMDVYPLVQLFFSFSLVLHSFASVAQLFSLDKSKTIVQKFNSSDIRQKKLDEIAWFNIIRFIQLAYLVFAFGAIIFPLSTYRNWHYATTLTAVLCSFLSSFFSWSYATPLLLLTVPIVLVCNYANVSYGLAIAELWFFSGTLIRPFDNLDENVIHHMQCMIQLSVIKLD